MKGIVLAGGSGTRLHPLTLAVSKQLMPVYDKPMIYYPLSTLISAGINEILIISTPKDVPLFKDLLGDGSQVGCSFQYAIQENPNGLAESFLIAENFIGKDAVALILGDNIFYGTGLSKLLQENTNPKGGIVYAYHVNDPERYGVIGFDEHGHTNRGELEITDINKAYLKEGTLSVRILDRGTAWLDTGTFDSLLQASNFVQVIEERQGLKVGSIEEEAFKSGFISKQKLKNLAMPLLKSGYGKNLIKF